MRPIQPWAYDVEGLDFVWRWLWGRRSTHLIELGISYRHISILESLIRVLGSGAKEYPGLCKVAEALASRCMASEPLISSVRARFKTMAPA